MAFFKKHDPSEPGDYSSPVCSVCVVTSAKGGVGKSTVCANLGAALAMRGLSVLMLDCDMPNRCLDLLFGLSEDVTCGLTDVLSGAVSADDAILSCSESLVLDLLPGFSDSAEETAACYEKVYELLLTLRKKYYDVLLVDMPGGSLDLLATVAKGADRALIVSTEQATAIRSAASTARLLSDAGLTDQQLIINQFVGGKNRRDRRESLIRTVKTIDEIGATLGGIVPFDPTVWSKQNEGVTLLSGAYDKTVFADAFRNIAARFCCESVPLFRRNR